MSHHKPFKALSPIDWESVPSSEALPDFLLNTFADAQTIIDSIPLPQGVASAIHGGSGGGGQPRPRPRQGQARRANPDAGPGAGNVRGIGAEKRAECVYVEGIGKVEVYQLSAQFPGPTTPRDFVTLLLTSAPETTADSDKKKKSRGPPAPRQFMIVSKPCVHPDCAPRQGFIRGQYESVEIIREIPVEIPLRKVRSSIDLNRDDVGDLSKAEQAALGREAIIQSARKATAGGSGDDGDSDDDEDARSVHSDVGTVKDMDASMGTGHETGMAVEWLMITRSDPGGSVPRFMVEKGTPAGIVSDAGRLLDWLASKSLEDLVEEPELDKATADAAGGDVDVVEEGSQGQEQQKRDQPETQGGTAKPKVPKKEHEAPIENLVPNPKAQADDVPPVAPASGLYSMITGAIGVAGSAVASRIPFGGSLKATDSEPELDGGDDDTAPDDSSDTSSVRTFNSAMESPEQKPQQPEEVPSLDGTSTLTEEASTTETLRKAPSSNSKESESSAAPSRASLQHEKELRKLHERRRKVQDKMAKLHERSLSKQQEERQKDEQATARLREKHEREVARQEEKYQRELRKIEERRRAEEKKAADRRRKQMEREEKASLALELEHARAELDVALKQVDLLKDQIGELQSQNTMLVATLGKHGLLKGGGIDALSELKRSASSASSRSTR
ncbi:hypothetical protein MAPG_08328 [Magnaporthiopsis poae ATCC 64411]|uniref:DUF3074 domain-containing protein n=1 Tax=Magnaporthiopsis poae (strain ATCC 64411 / 73-15) TaxID=644358 RepID=A0A0C4E729_MAGP6|nr:hypothetical protein MAPG_08328 [Magnaporthiopsis poae ATCC 64411]